MGRSRFGIVYLLLTSPLSGAVRLGSWYALAVPAQPLLIISPQYTLGGLWRMTTMPSFDIVSEIEMHEVTNAVDQAKRDLGNRWDFKNVDANIELEDKRITVSAEQEFQLEQLKIGRASCRERV